MNRQAEFESSGRIVWDEVERRPTDMFRMQSGMFMDRADLWPMKRRGDRRRVKMLLGQYELPIEEGKEDGL
jgi:hypothetical protein